jgi:hypothetical protein
LGSSIKNIDEYVSKSGGDEAISIDDAIQDFYDGLIAGEDIEVDGVVDTDTSDFAFTSSNGQGILQLASAVPEPSTWAMMIGGRALFFFAFGRLPRAA